MTKESPITSRQAICIIAMFVFGSSAILGGTSAAGQDSWMLILLGAVTVMPFALIYARITKLFPEMDIFDVAIAVFGKIFGRFFIILFTVYSFHLGALVLRNFSEFVRITTMSETHQIPLLILMVSVCAYLVYKGIQILGKWSVIVLPIVVLVVLLTIFLALWQMDFSNIFPIMSHDLATMADGTLETFSFPFGETVLFLTIAASVRKKDNPYKIYTLGIVFGALILLTVFFRNLFILGVPVMENVFFPSYATVRIVSIGDFLSRLEGTMTSNFLLAGISKATVCLFGATKGIAKLFNIKNDKIVILPVCILMTADAYFVYYSIMEMISFIDLYKFAALPFQILLPVIIWIGAEIKTRKDKAQMKPKASSCEETGGEEAESEA